MYTLCKNTAWKIPPKDLLPNNQLENMKHRKANKSKSKRTLPSSLPFIMHIKNSSNFLTKSRKIEKKGKEKKTTLLLIKSQKRSRTSFKPYKKTSST
jgi:hypothetical protein